MASPIHSLPTEILTHILSMAACHCKIYPTNGSIPPILSPVVFSAVCKHWRQVAANHPFLWAHLDLVVDAMDPYRKYYSPEIWVERSKGALLSVHVHQPRFASDDYRFAKGESLSYGFQHLGARSTAIAISRLIRFLTPLMPQVYSLTTTLSGRWRSILHTLIDNWMKNGINGQAKVLKAVNDCSSSELDIRSSRSCCLFLESLRVLHLYNGMISWRKFSFSNLVELEIEQGAGHWRMAVHQLASIISSCPKLQHLALSRLHLTDTALQQPRSILLGELRALRITDLQTDDDEIHAGLYESVLDLISPGQNALSVEISLTYVSESIQQALDAVRSFVERSNVSKLYVHGKPVSGLWRGDPYFASQLGPLPRVQTLILEAFCFCDVVRIKSCLLAIDDNDGINTLHNPRPINSELVLWPDVRNLYLRQCIIEGEYLHHLVLLRSVQTLYLRDCATNLEAGLDPDSDSGASVGTQRSTEECAQLLSQAGLKVVTSPTWDISWPSFLL